MLNLELESSFSNVLDWVAKLHNSFFQLGFNLSILWQYALSDMQLLFTWWECCVITSLLQRKPPSPSTLFYRRKEWECACVWQWEDGILYIWKSHQLSPLVSLSAVCSSPCTIKPPGHFYLFFSHFQPLLQFPLYWCMPQQLTPTEQVIPKMPWQQQKDD